MESLKCVMVGDGNVGKTCLGAMYTSQTFPDNYQPTVLQNIPINFMYNGEPCRMEIWDTAGQEGYDTLRPMSYHNTDVFLLCFAIDEPASYSNAEKMWYPEIRHFCPNADVILVGTKMDLRDDVATIENLNRIGRYPITLEQGLQMAKRIKAFKYMECSALLRIGYKEIFECAVTAYFKRKIMPPRRRTCSIL